MGGVWRKTNGRRCNARAHVLAEMGSAGSEELEIRNTKAKDLADPRITCEKYLTRSKVGLVVRVKTGRGATAAH